MRAIPKQPVIYLITPGELTIQNYQTEADKLLDMLRIAVECDIPLVQIREKDLPARHLAEFVNKAVALAKGSGTRIIVNERSDIAAAAGAAGVHLRSDSMSAREVKAAFPQLLTIVSCHSVEGLTNARENSADIATFSPIFSTPGKGAAKGIGALRDACRQMAGFPVIALGGIDESNYRSVIEAGAAGFAAIRYLNDADNLRRLSSEVKNYQ